MEGYSQYNRGNIGCMYGCVGAHNNNSMKAGIECRCRVMRSWHGSYRRNSMLWMLQKGRTCTTREIKSQSPCSHINHAKIQAGVAEEEGDEAEGGAADTHSRPR